MHQICLIVDFLLLYFFIPLKKYSKFSSYKYNDRKAVNLSQKQKYNYAAHIFSSPQTAAYALGF